jgi:hypothetical protein
MRLINFQYLYFLNYYSYYKIPGPDGPDGPEYSIPFQPVPTRSNPGQKEERTVEKPLLQ